MVNMMDMIKFKGVDKLKINKLGKEIKKRKDVNGNIFYDKYEDGRYIKSDVEMEALN